jgi:hypothetical protein
MAKVKCNVRKETRSYENGGGNWSYKCSMEHKRPESRALVDRVWLWVKQALLNQEGEMRADRPRKG